jgi:hypothetical protein
MGLLPAALIVYTECSKELPHKALGRMNRSSPPLTTSYLPVGSRNMADHRADPRVVSTTFPEIWAPGGSRPGPGQFQYDVLSHGKDPTQSQRWPLLVATDYETAAAAENTIEELPLGGAASLLREIVALRGGWRDTANTDADARDVALSFLRDVVLPPASAEQVGESRQQFSILETEPNRLQDGAWPKLRPMVKAARGGVAEDDQNEIPVAADIVLERPEPVPERPSPIAGLFNSIAGFLSSRQAVIGEPAEADVIPGPPVAEVTEGEVMPFVEPHAIFEAASGQPVEDFEKAAHIAVEMVTRHEIVAANGCTRTHALVQFVFDAGSGEFITCSTLNYFVTLDPHNKYVDFDVLLTVG